MIVLKFIIIDSRQIKLGTEVNEMLSVWVIDELIPNKATCIPMTIDIKRILLHRSPKVAGFVEVSSVPCGWLDMEKFNDPVAHLCNFGYDQFTILFLEMIPLNIVHRIHIKYLGVTITIYAYQ